jgi:SAM-dependent methyltransferase
MDEIDKYRTIYSSPADRWQRYGHTNHGKHALPLVAGCGSLLDVGCGYNEFAIACRAQGIAAMGVDFACPGADILAPAQALPFPDKRYEVVTAFDMLEHLRPEEVRPVLREFARIAERFVFSISYVASVNKVEGETLHPTVRPEVWWIQRIAEAGGVVVKQGKYLTGTWGVEQAPPVAPGESCILVGNGPALLKSSHGPQIDAFDQVVRFNEYRTIDYTDHTGTKTTLWSTFGHGYRPGPGEALPNRIIYTHGDVGGPALEAAELWRIPQAFHNDLRRRVQEASIRDEEGKAKIIPSSGLTVAAWLTEIVELSSPLRLAGFDHFRKQESSQHHYWNPKSFKAPPEHDGEAEAAIFETLPCEHLS